MVEVRPKCGIEIHQRLDANKLFCSCHFDANKDSGAEEGHKVLKRRLRAIAGEGGSFDAAVLYEAGKGKEFSYKYLDESSCLVELDEEPPHSVDEEALEFALSVAQVLHCKIPDVIFVMRKTVIDGSNVSGFQRSALVGYDGSLETKSGRVGIASVCLEEESAQIGEGGHTYHLDRLGIPLVEIATTPDIKDGMQLQEVAENIGLLLRSSGKVQRGIGTIRQDVNISINNGERNELKGVQDLRALPQIFDLEVKRQSKIRELEGKLKKAGMKVGRILDYTRNFYSPSFRFYKNLNEGQKVVGFRIDNFSGLLGFETLPGRRFASELSDFVKNFGLGGLMHSDEDFSKYGVEGVIKEIREKERASEKDAYIFVVEKEERAQRVLEILIDRIREICKNGFLGEVRRVNSDNSTSFLRPIPGSARMYPETDVVPIVVSKRLLDEAKDKVKFLFPSEVILKLKKLGLAEEQAKFILKNVDVGLFERLVKSGHKPTYLVEFFAGLEKEDLDLSVEQIEKVLGLVKSGRVAKNQVLEAAKDIVSGGRISMSSNSVNAEKLVREEYEKLKRMPNFNKEKALGVLIGRLKSRVNPEVIIGIFKNL